MSTTTYSDKSMVSSQFKRNDHDFYETERRCVDAIIPHLNPVHKMWECAAGAGAISDVLEEDGFTVFKSDLVDRGKGFDQLDFLSLEELPYPCHTIITNPPYGKDAEAFINKGLELLPPYGFLVLLMRNEYDCAKKRHYLFGGNKRFFKKVVLNFRPKWIKGSTGSPRHNYAWYMWYGTPLDQKPILCYGGTKE